VTETDAAAEAQLAHEILARDFTDRYLRRSGFDRFAYSAAWDPEDPLCDYDSTWWRAKPNRFSEPVGKLVLGRMHRLSGKQIDSHFTAPFEARAAEITAALPDHPVSLVNGHDIDLQAALSLLAASMGVAHASTSGRYQQVLERTIGLSHGVATRGLAPIVVGRPRLPGRLTFLRLQQLVVNPHLSFPINRQMVESGIPQDFRKRYNAKLRRETIEVANNLIDQQTGFRTLWSMAPGGTPDFAGEGEHEGKLLTKLIEPATIRLFSEMNCALLPVYTKFGRGRGETVVELGAMVPPDQVTDQTVPTMMADIAEFRRRHGEQNVFYEGELAATGGDDPAAL
jgi:hypothetical protein